MTGVDVTGLGPQGVLDDPTGQDAQTLRNKLDVALAYIANWYKATKGSADQDVWWTRINQVRALVETAERAMDPGIVFPGKTEIAAYNAAAPAFVQLWQDLTLSSDTLPHPELLSQIADYLTTTIETPFTLVRTAANAAGDAAAALNLNLGKAVRDAIFALWPLLAIAAGGVILYFGAPLIKRGVRSVAA